MSERSYRPPCYKDLQDEDASISRQMCARVGGTILAAGGAGLLEVVPCPMSALAKLTVDEENPGIAELRQRLGFINQLDPDTDQ